MSAITAIAAFSLAAGLLTITPGLDTALVLRTATVEGPKKAMAAGAGIVCGVLAWGLIASLGLGAILAVSEIAYRLLQYAGAAYLLWLGLNMIRAGLLRNPPMADPLPHPERRAGRMYAWYWRGLLTNLLNPKVGVFYLSFLPQFIPPDVPVVPFSLGLAAIHAAMGLLWFALLTLATRPLAHALRTPHIVRLLDGLTGGVLVLFGLKLAFAPRA